jgi:hypothetical protein
MLQASKRLSMDYMLQTVEFRLRGGAKVSYCHQANSIA